MCMPLPEGYGSISSWYQCRSSAGASGAGFGTLKARASAQTRCHFASICSGSYLSIVLQKRKSLSRERPGELDAASPRVVPALSKKLLGHRADRSNQAGLAHLFRYTLVTPGSRLPPPTDLAAILFSRAPRHGGECVPVSRRLVQRADCVRAPALPEQRQD